MDRTVLFNKLNTLRHITPKQDTIPVMGTQTSLFDDPMNIRPTSVEKPTTTEKPDMEYWRAFELQQLCGVENMPWGRGKKQDMQESMIDLIAGISGKDCSDSYKIFQSHVISETSPKGRITYDMKMSRYASWALTVGNYNMPFMRAYFALPGESIETISATANEFNRINMGNRLTARNRRIAGILHHDKIQLNRFYDSLHNAFFDNMSIFDLKTKNGIKITANDSIHNYMDASAMAAMADGIDAIIIRYENKYSRHNSDIASCIAVEEMKKARFQLTERTNRTPTQYINKISIKEVRAKLKQLEQAFTKEYMSNALTTK